MAPDANFQIHFGGSFELGKSFTIAALIADPADGQSLELDLPKGMKLLEGKRIQPVPAENGDEPWSMVLWKGQVLEYGRYPMRIRSNTGVTKTATVTIGPAK